MQYLLDTLSISGYVAAGVSRVIEKRGNGDSVLLKTDVEELQLIVDALECQQKIGRRQIQKISEQHYLLSSYDKKARADRLKEEETPARSNEPLFIQKLKDFKRACKNEMKNAAKENYRRRLCHQSMRKKPPGAQRDKLTRSL